MWRALLTRRAALLALAVGGAVAISVWRAGPVPPAGYRAADGAALADPAVAENLAAHLAAEHGLIVDPLELRITATDDALLGAGRPLVAWVTAGQPADLYAVRARISEAGVPVALDRPRNVTGTIDGHELLLDANDRRVLYAVQVGERVPSVVVLDFGEGGLPADADATTRLAAAVDARQSYGTRVGPQRLDVLLSPPSSLVFGGLSGDTAHLSTDAGELTVDLSAATVEPPERGRVLSGAAPAHEAWGLLADALRRSGVVGPARLMAAEDVLFTVSDWLRRQRHRVFPTAADRLPPAPIVDVAPAPPTWPPPAVGPVEGGLPGEGRWTPAATMADAADPAVVQTFVRVDPERPYARTHLFAFDLRRLGLHFVSGTRHPRSTTGARGSGRIDPGHRPRLVAAFNGGLTAEHGRFGVIEDGRLLVRPAPGLATVVTTGDGEVGFGLWDAEALAPPWVGLRQNLAPLIEGGVVNPRRVRHWGKLVAALDAAQTPRSAIGVTAAGVLIYGWAPAASAERLGEAMRRAGVEFAMHLDMSPGHTGLELYRPGADGVDAVRGAAAMDFRPRRWLETDARDFFYIARAERLPPPVPLDAAAPDEGRWRPIQRLDGGAVIAQSWLTAERVGALRQLPLYLIEAERLRPHLVPGLVEVPPSTGVPPAELELPGAPVAWFEAGLRAAGSPFGFVVGGRTWRAPQPGVMTLAVDADGDIALGRYRDGVDADTRWIDLLQGPALLTGGRIAEGAVGRTAAPLAAAGRRPDGRLVLTMSADGDRRAMAEALRIAGATDALLLGERGTVDTGAMRVYFAHGDALRMTVGPTGALRPARLAAGAPSALVFTGRRPPPSARVLPTFVGGEPVR